MNKFEEKSNNDIQLEMKQLEADYAALKIKLANDYDKLLAIETDYALAGQTITKRLKG